MFESFIVKRGTEIFAIPPTILLESVRTKVIVPVAIDSVTVAIQVPTIDGFVVVVVVLVELLLQEIANIATPIKIRLNNLVIKAPIIYFKNKP
jgi:hypothetical protein